MKTHVVRRRLVALGACLLLAACHHASPDPNPGGCQLTHNDGTNAVYTYNAAGQLVAILYATRLGDTRYDYTYAGSQATLAITYEGNSVLRQDYVLTLNPQGFVTQAEGTLTGTNLRFVNGRYRFAYDASSHLIAYRATTYSIDPSSGNVLPAVSQRVRLDYQGGDLAQVYDSVNGSRTTLGYTTQPNRLRLPLLFENDFSQPLRIADGLLPLAGKPPAHLVSTAATVGPSYPVPTKEQLTYTLDNGGQVTQYVRSPDGRVYKSSNTCP